MALSASSPAAATPENAALIELQAFTNGGDNSLNVTLAVTTGAPYSRCDSGWIALHGRRRSLPALRTGARSGARWVWEIAAGAPAGTMTARVGCDVDHRRVWHSTRFEVRSGPGAAQFRRIDVPGSMHVGTWNPQSLRHGSGGGGDLYPPGQCTSLVAQLRPDIPYFPGASGDARNWAVSAARAGWIVDRTPAVGAVAVFQPGQHGAGYMGHVAYVKAVIGSQIVVIDRNWHDDGVRRERITSWSGLDFIHSRKPPPTIIQNQPVLGVPETTGGAASTWTDYTNAGGTPGPQIQSNQTVQIACKIRGFVVSDTNPWWYRIASSPWNSAYYVSADAFYNNGRTSGSLAGTPFFDPAVPDC